MLNFVSTLAAGLLFVASAGEDAAETPPRIKPESARQYVGQTVEVVFEVKASKKSEHRTIIYLDSEENFRDDKNLGVFITERGAADLKRKRNIDAPHEFYRGKTIRVVGKIATEEDRPHIKLDEAQHLDVYEEKSAQ